MSCITRPRTRDLAVDLGHRAHFLPSSPTASSPQITVLPIRAGNPTSTTTLSARLVSVDRPCHIRTASLAPTDRAHTPQIRHTFPPPLLRSLYILQCFPHLSSPPSELRLGRVLRRLDRDLTVVQPIGLTVELPSTAHGPSSSRTWIGRTLGRTLFGTPQGLRRRRPRRHSA